MDGKAHSIMGVVTCVTAWTGMLVITRNFSAVGLLAAILFGGLFSLYADLDLKVHLWYGHRSPIFHSALIPLSILVLICIPGYIARPEVIELGRQSIIFIYNVAISVSIYWCIAHGSHLLADLGGKQPVGMEHVTGKLFLLVNGLLLISAGLLAGVYLLV